MFIQGSENGFVLWLLGAKAEVVLPSFAFLRLLLLVTTLALQGQSHSYTILTLHLSV